MKFFMHSPYGEEGDKHAERLKRGLLRLGPGFLASLCWWCHGTASHKFEHCTVCGKHYGSALGLLVNNEPAPSSVVNQVLVAAGEDA